MAQIGSTISPPSDDQDVGRNEAGFIFNPNTDLAGIEYRISGYTQSVAEVRIEDTGDQELASTTTNTDNNNDYQLHATLNSGTEYKILIATPGGEQVGEASANYNYTSTDFDIICGYGKVSSDQFRDTDDAYAFSKLTALLPSEIPDIPQNVDSFVYDQTKINPNWDSTNWNGEEGHYNVYRSTSSGSSRSDYTNIANVSSGTTSYTDSGLREGERYYYRVDAENSEGKSNLSAEIADTTGLSPPSNVTLSN